MWPNFSKACERDILRTLRSGRLTAYRANPLVGVGPQEWSQVYAFEREVERKFRVKHAVACNSGTAALHAALCSLGIAGREVVTSPYTFSASASAILLAGGVPRFADVDPHTFCITKETVKRAITKKTACILPVHLFGYFQDLAEMQSLGIPVVEDACQAVGASRGNTFSGTRGSAGAYSFNGGKNLPSGEGGCLVTNDEKIAEKARRFINHSENFGSETVGVNYRMHELVAVLARHGLKELEERNRKRIQLVNVLELRRDGFALVARGTANVYYVYPFTVKSGTRDRFIDRCAKRGLAVGAGYIQPLISDYPAFKKYRTHPLPVAEELSRKTLCLLSNLTPDKPIKEAYRTAEIIRESLE